MEDAQPDESVWSSIAFWLVAFTAAALFAAVLVAPQWEQGELLGGRVRYLAAQCRYLTDVNGHLERVIEAFKHDPDFTGEMARSELDYSLADEQRLPAPLRHRSLPQPPRPESAAPDPWAPVLRLFARDRLVRRTALLTAAVFALVGLALFHPPPRGEGRGSKARGRATPYRRLKDSLAVAPGAVRRLKDEEGG